MDIRKSLTDAGYIAVGLGVMGVQQAQVRRRQLQTRLGETGTYVAGRARDLQGRVQAHGQTLDAKAREARDRAEGTVNQTVTRVQELAGEVTTRVEPVIVQVQATAVAELSFPLNRGSLSTGEP
jgi:hypothetical protein